MISRGLNDQVISPSSDYPTANWVFQQTKGDGE
ncbi:Uncharacterized protein APZ42_020980 [Daphnia magna]|uniref:Uncharacterized protein n=1 Tax=Daphnia magna TaxID=35525 RepID=A0A164X2P5_9CRUS|nr:Uncharacterized protein APZ42_020980 [Daphnia magna]